ncbi:hypothetical protein LguiA_019206 [Lonicera macranthoides]
MQREREGRDDSTRLGSPFDSFGIFGPQRSMMSSIFGRRDPFDDPFFTRPFDSMFGSSGPGDSVNVSRSRAPIIEELNSDDEREVEDEDEANDTGTRGTKDKAQKRKKSSKAPLVEHPDDQDNGKLCCYIQLSNIYIYIYVKPKKRKKSSKDPLVEHPDDQDNGEKSKELQHRSDYNRVQGTQPRSQAVSFRKVTYGGIDGAYYTATTTRRTGGDGVVLEESKQADITTGQAAHRISKGIYNKGHTVTRKLDADGRVDTMQTLHNLNEDELASFERDWKGNVERHLPGWNDGTSSSRNAGASSRGQNRRAATGSWALPVSEFLGRGGGMGRNSEPRTHSSGVRAKKVVTINID